MRFNVMHFMPYVHLPAHHRDYPSTWVSFPNRYYDPQRGRDLYQQYLSQLVLADRLGFDGLVVTEHHNAAYSMTASPSLIAAALIPQTANARICVWGTPPNFVLPNRLAEEYATLDVLSDGRLEVAFPLGTGMEYWAHPVNPATAQERFRESLKVVLQAWREDGPTTHYGRHYTYRFLNPWPRPLQRPHPPCYIAGTGSAESVEIAAEHGFGYAAVFVPRERAAALNDTLRRRAEAHGHAIGPGQLPLQAWIYVAETQDQAEREFVDHFRRFFEDFARTTPHYLAPPGYLSAEQFRQRAVLAERLQGGFDYEAVCNSFFVAVGTPEKVANQIGEWSAGMKTTHFNNVMHVADMPHWKAVKNLTLFAEEVMPRLRARAAPSRRAAAE